MKKRRLSAFDLFAGCGGLSLGLEWAGFSIVGAVEKDALSAQTYSINHPKVRVWHCDVRDLDAAAVRRELQLEPGQLDIFAGCPPCQGFSSLRTLNGSRAVHDARNDLIVDFLRFVKEFAPKIVMMENVPALATDSRFNQFHTAIESLGYTSEYRILDAANYCVPQRRRRLMFIGSRTGRVVFASPSTTKTTVRDAIGSLPRAGRSGDPLHDFPELRQPHVADLIRRIPKNGGSRHDIGAGQLLKCHQGSNGFRDVYGRMAWDEPSPTITSGCVNPSKGRFLHPDADRSITLREAALLQSFPTDYVFPLERGKFAVAEMLGNALPPRFVQIHAAELARRINRTE